MIHRDIDLRHDGYTPVAGAHMFQRPDRAFQHDAVQTGDAVVFQVGKDIWGVYHRPVTA